MRDSRVQNHGGAVDAASPSPSPQEHFTSSSIKPPLPSSFEFCVWSDDGINLHVDLNSSPSDWGNRFASEVHISESENIVHANKIRSLGQDIGCLKDKRSFLWNTNSDGQVKSSSTLKLTKDGVRELDRQNEGDTPFISDSLTPCSMTIKVADNLKQNRSPELALNVLHNLNQDQSTVSAEVSYGAPNNFISGAESCAKDVSEKILDSDAANTPFNKSLCDSVGNSLSDPATLEIRNSKPHNEFSEDCALLDGSCFVRPGVVCPQASLSSSMELQISEVVSCRKYASVSFYENDESQDLSDPRNTSDTEQVGLVNSSEINLDTDANNFPSLTEEWEVAKIVDRRESSECSQYDDPLKKSGLEFDEQESKVELRKKRKNRDPDIQGLSGKPAARILRSTKNTAVMVLPRRSMRLISK